MIDLKVSTIQSALSWESPDANRTHFGSLIEQLDEPHVIVLPEMFTTGFSMNPSQHAEDFHLDMITLQWMREIASKKNSCITGTVAVKDDDLFYNRMFWVDPQGSVEYADKRHLFTLGKEDDHYSPGKTKLIVDCHGWNINLMCCYDLRFPAWCRNSMHSGKPEFDLQIFMANWPDKRVQHWDALLLARAIENQSYVCGVNIVGDDGNGVSHSGHSAIYSGMGDTLIRHTNDEESIHTTELSSRDLEFLRRSLSFLKDADQITLT